MLFRSLGENCSFFLDLKSPWNFLLLGLAKRGNDTITFIDETLYANFSINSWWIDSGATVHVTNSLQGFLTARTLRKGERSLRVADGKEAEVKSVGSISLVLDSGFILRLNNVVYVPSIRRNLISVSLLDDDGFKCNFGNNKCIITFNSNDVGLAFRQDKLYMLSLNESPVSLNVCDAKRKNNDETSSKYGLNDSATVSKKSHHYFYA